MTISLDSISEGDIDTKLAIVSETINRLRELLEEALRGAEETSNES
ncbi:MAG: hypothetical protein KKG33_14085 [candidate division Zixibacteria bacterium]|nr:hypothetical protein [candidate division Zixibacteria bacterium]